MFKVSDGSVFRLAKTVYCGNIGTDKKANYEAMTWHDQSRIRAETVRRRNERNRL